MSPVIGRLAILLLCFASAGVAADPVEDALRSGGMLDVLEAHLTHELEHANSDERRDELIERLAVVYTDLMRQMDATDPRKEDLVRRAWRLADRAGEDRVLDLRLSLVLDQYLPLERAAALAEVELLADEEREESARQLRLVRSRLGSLSRASIVDAATAEQAARRKDGPEFQEVLQEARRRRSLANYYLGWSGLSLAILEGRQPGDDVLPAFGWLLGAEGEPPQIEDLNPNLLEYDHVARAALGVASARAHSDDRLQARAWFALIIESDRASAEVRQAARLRLLRAQVVQQNWNGAYRHAIEIRLLSGKEEPLPTPDARFVVLHTLRASASTGRAPELVEIALEDLLERGEIGQVLDLRRRFGSRLLMTDGFVARYASALEAMDEASRLSQGLYTTAARELQRALDASDAARFRSYRHDALLKLAFCLMQIGEPDEAVRICRELLAEDPEEPAREEASWSLIVGLSEQPIDDDQSRESLRRAIRAYLDSYGQSARASRLLVRYAGTGLIEPEEAIDGLRGVDESDPVRVRARRTLAVLLYRAWVDAGKRPDERPELIEIIRWVWDHQEEAPDNAGERRARMDLARIAIEVAFAPEADHELARAGIDRGEALLAADSTLEAFGADLTVSRIEWMLRTGQVHEAETLHERWRVESAGTEPDATRRADRLVLDAALRRTGDDDDGSTDRTIVRVGSRVIAGLTPPAPESLPRGASGIVSRVIDAAVRLWSSTGEDEFRAVGLRLGGLLLDRGTPSGQLLRDLAQLAATKPDYDTEFRAWSVLLSASEVRDESWWEARYHTLRLLSARSIDRARQAYEQHLVLYPETGPEPWATRIAELFSPVESEGGGKP